MSRRHRPWQVQLARLRTDEENGRSVRLWNWALRATAMSRPLPPNPGALAARTVQEMKERGATPDGFTFAQATSLCVSKGEARYALALLREARLTGCANAWSYTNAADACKRKGKIRAAETVLMAMRHDNVDFNAKTRFVAVSMGLSLEDDAGPLEGSQEEQALIVAKLSSFDRNQEWKQVLECYERLESMGSEVGASVTSQALRACARLQLPDTAARIAKSAPKPLSDKAQSMTIRAIGRSNQGQRWEVALEFFRSIPFPTTWHFSEVLRVLSDVGECDTAYSILSSIPHEIKNGHHCAFVMACFRKAGNAKEALRLHEDMILTGVNKPLIAAHHEAMLAHMELNDMHACMELFQKAILEGCGPTVFSFILATRCCASNSRSSGWRPDPDLSLDILLSMKSYKLIPTDDICANVVNAFVRAGRWTEVDDVMDDLKSAGITAASSKRSGWAVLRAKSPLGNWLEAETALRSDLSDEGGTPSFRDAWSAAILSCISAGRLAEALSLVNEMNAEWNEHPREGVYNSLIYSASRANEQTLVWALLDNMRNAKVYPTRRTYRRAIQGFYSAKNTECMGALYAQAVSEGVINPWCPEDDTAEVKAGTLNLLCSSTAVAAAATSYLLDAIQDGTEGGHFGEFIMDDLIIQAGSRTWQEGERSATSASATSVLDAAQLKWVWQDVSRGRLLLPAEEIFRWQRMGRREATDTREWLS